MRNRLAQKRRWRHWTGVAGILIVLGLPQSVTRAQTLAVVAAAPPPELTGRILRVIEDPVLNVRWMLVPDLVHPSGPGHLICVPAESQSSVRCSSGWVASPSGGAPRQGVLERADAHLRLVVRAGDRLQLVTETEVARVRLEAVATESATAGETFRARLVLGGKVVRAVALGPGHATFEPLSGGWR